MEQRYAQLIQAVEQAGSAVLQHFGQSLLVEQKSCAADFRTQADLESERHIAAAIQKLFPAYNIMGEEYGSVNKDSEFTFIIDPLDGTNNFALNIPLFSISVALHQHGKALFGIIHNPFLKKSFHAFAGEGAFCNGVQTRVSTISELARATIAYTCSYETPRTAQQSIIGQVIRCGAKRCTTFWAPAWDYCLLASGKIEAIISEQAELYDFAAGKLIAREAGARVTDFFGAIPADDAEASFVASNSSGLHGELLKVISDASTAASEMLKASSKP